MSSTVAPAPSKASFALSASSLETPVKMSDGAPSTSSFASFSPRLVRPLTSLITCIFCDPASERTTSYESFSAAPASSPPPAGAAATATGAAAVTSNFSSNASKNSFKF